MPMRPSLSPNGGVGVEPITSRWTSLINQEAEVWECCNMRARAAQLLMGSPQTRNIVHDAGQSRRALLFHSGFANSFVVLQNTSDFV